MSDTPVGTVGLVTDSLATIYTPSGTKTATVLMIRCFETVGGNAVTLYQKVGAGTARQIDYFSLGSANQKGESVGPYTLANGDAIQAIASITNQSTFAVQAYEHS